MTTADIETLHDQALELYVQGRYAEAVGVWEEILSAAPDDPRAVEGVQMAQVLAGQWASGAAQDAGGPDAGGASVSLPEALAKLEGLLDAGRAHDAMSAARIMREAFPESGEVRALAGRAASLLESEAFVTGELGRAMVALQLGDPDEARRACRQVLAFDPENGQAHSLLRLADDVVAQPDQQIPTHTSPTREDVLAERSLAPPPVPQPPQVRRSPDSPAGSLFEMPDDSAGIEPLTLAVGGGPSVPAAIPGGAEDSSFASLSGEFDGMGNEGESAPLSGFETPALDAGKRAAPSNAAPLAPSSSPRSAAAFSDLDQEIGEVLAVPAPEGDFDFDMAPGGTSVEQGVSAPASGEAAAADGGDLDFAGEAEASSQGAQGGADAGWSDLNAAVGSATPSPSTRIAALIEEARQHIEAGRYSEAIESAARAFAVDPDAPGAQQLIDEARTRQEAADRQAELGLSSARKALADGRLDEAEGLYRQVLEIHPGHREVLDALDTISRRQNEEEIRNMASVPAADTEPEQAEEPPPPRPAPKAQSGRPAMPPEVEALVPRPRPQAQTEAPAPAAVEEPPAEPSPAAPSASAKTVKKARFTPDQKRRIYLIAGAAAGLIVIGLLGIKLIGRLRGSKPAPANIETTAPSPARKSKAAQQPAVPAAASAKPQAAPTYPQTFQEAKRLLAEGKLDEARDILNNLLTNRPGEIQSMSLLKSVQDQILLRDQTARMMGQIESSFKQSRFDDALRLLYRLPPEMQKGQIERYKANAWYDDALQFLLGGNVREALRCLDEALAINPGDEEARRIKEYASSYMDREKDGAYLRYVEALPKRPMTWH